jgi:hypothetical protein
VHVESRLEANVLTILLVYSATQHKQTTCKCLDPIQPKDRLDSQQWSRVHHFNKEAAEAKQGDVDVLFLGDSITEGWSGTSWGRKNARVHNVPQVFQSLFSVENGGEYEGLALGIAGDTVSDVVVVVVVAAAAVDSGATPRRRENRQRRVHHHHRHGHCERSGVCCCCCR